MALQVRVGASGFSYKEWLGAFYPPKLPGPKMLAYAERLPTVEINYTFRAMPRRAMLERWAEQTPAHFRFALKAPQRITHFARLRDTAETVGFFADTAGALGERLGPVLFQLPPDLPRLGLLRDSSRCLADACARPSSSATLRGLTATRLCKRSATAAPPCASPKAIAWRARSSAPPHTFTCACARKPMTTRRSGNGPRAWRVGEGAEEIFVYFKHETGAPELAARLGRLLADRM